ncbi:MAG: GCN5-related N-acetyltransferase [Pelosinus sp.]|jgi:ribosomal protein S18 acetylase RimI-like enzyme|nr:GCN5-related N-acetyltransferase [Pelosinus sp.]
MSHSIYHYDGLGGDCMTKSHNFTAQDTCEMTVVPGGIIDCASHHAYLAIQQDFTALNNCNLDHLEKTRPLSFPIHIDALNRRITLTHKPLSHEYQNQIMRFKSAYTPLLHFLQIDALVYEESGNTCTTLYFEKDTNQLVGFCSIKSSSLKLRGNNILSLCPSIEIAALCIHDEYRYMGIGQTIFTHTIQGIYALKKMVGIQLVTLFALPEAVAFYQKFNFRKLEKGMKIFYSSAHKRCIPMYFPLLHITTDKQLLV